MLHELAVLHSTSSGSWQWPGGEMGGPYPGWGSANEKTMSVPSFRHLLKIHCG